MSHEAKERIGPILERFGRAAFATMPRRRCQLRFAPFSSGERQEDFKVNPELAQPIADFFSAEEQRDKDAMSRCFAEDAIVRTRVEAYKVMLPSASGSWKRKRSTSTRLSPSPLQRKTARLSLPRG